MDMAALTIPGDDDVVFLRRPLPLQSFLK
jgi:hypothetical protein